MIYRFLLFALILFVTNLNVVTDGFTHWGYGESNRPEYGSMMWDNGNAEWEMGNDNSSAHPTITAYASANITRLWYPALNTYKEYGFGHASVSAGTLTITVNGYEETHTPEGRVRHHGYVYYTSNSTGKHPHTKGDNNVDMTNYYGVYSQSTSAYNPIYHVRSDSWYLSARGSCRISNSAEERLDGETVATTWAEVP